MLSVHHGVSTPYSALITSFSRAFPSSMYLHNDFFRRLPFCNLKFQFPSLPFLSLLRSTVFQFTTGEEFRSPEGTFKGLSWSSYLGATRICKIVSRSCHESHPFLSVRVIKKWKTNIFNHTNFCNSLPPTPTHTKKDNINCISTLLFYVH